MDTFIETFTEDQKRIFNTVIKAGTENESCQIFIVARGGCEKTYLLNAILVAVRSSNSDEYIALAMTTSGIAAQILSLGRTFYSRLKASLHPDRN